MKKLMIGSIVMMIVVLFGTAPAAAGVAHTATIGRITSVYDGWVYLVMKLPGGTTPDGVCKLLSGDNMKFQATTAGGKAMFSTLLGAKLTNKTVSVWYSDPGKGAAINSCGPGELSMVSSVAVE